MNLKPKYKETKKIQIKLFFFTKLCQLTLYEKKFRWKGNDLIIK